METTISLTPWRPYILASKTLQNIICCKSCFIKTTNSLKILKIIYVLQAEHYKTYCSSKHVLLAENTWFLDFFYEIVILIDHALQNNPFGNVLIVEYMVSKVSTQLFSIFRISKIYSDFSRKIGSWTCLKLVCRWQVLPLGLYFLGVIVK